MLSEPLMRPRFTWRLRSRSLPLGERTLVIGVVNVTPDSFSDGGESFSSERAVARALQLLAEGADIVDIGGESTRPGKKEPVTEKMELERVLPVIEGILKQQGNAVISIDTYKSGVARKAAEAGAEIVNDVSGFQWDTNMPEAIVETGCGAVLMHTRGRPEDWHALPPLKDPVETVKRELAYFTNVAIKFGVPREALVLDPGFGFGKSFEENHPLLARFEELHQLGLPLMSGTSRKSFIGRALRRGDRDAPPAERLYGTLATVAVSVMKGAHMVRVHDVAPTVDVVRVMDQLLAVSS
jgi:dihydropteroate synthase